MTTETYKQALKQAKEDLAKQIGILGQAQETVAASDKAIVELRQTISALQQLCGEPEFVEEDALGLTDAIRQVLRTAERGEDLSAQDVRERMESMGDAKPMADLLTTGRMKIWLAAAVLRELEAQPPTVVTS